MYLPAITPILIALLSLSTTTDALRKPSDAILLSQVKTLTLRSNAQTAHRRVPAVPQLKCIGGAGCKHYEIDTMRCKNAGSDYGPEDIQWTCTANIPEEFKLGSTDVICEGYDGPDDPYVLKGSCGVEYRLLLTEKGEERYGGGGWSEVPETQTVLQSLFMLLFVGVGVYILYSIYKAWRNPPPAAPRPAGGFWGGGWGGGGGGGNDPFDPPPPYPGYPGAKPGGAQQGWQPGFWSGALGGAAAGYLAGNRGNSAGYSQERRSFFGDNSGGFGYGSGGGRSWGGSPGQGPSRSNSGGSSTSARYESTGFGSTSRR